MKWRAERSSGLRIWSKLAKAVLASVIFFVSSLALAGPKIIFTGTFDPFHRNHFEQLEAALDAIPGSTAEVHPIEIAPHSAIAKISGTALPSLLSYDLRIAVIKAATAFDPRISVKDDFRVITAKVDDDTVTGMADITKRIKAQREYHGEKLFHLVGTDIIVLWIKSGELEIWPKDVNFVVGSNPELREEFFRIKERFKGDNRFVFFDKQRDPVRSTQIRGEFLEGKINWKQYLPEASANYLNSLPASKDPRADFLSRQAEFLIQYAQEEALDRLPKEQRAKWPQGLSERLDMLNVLYLEKADFDPKLQRVFERARRSFILIPYIQDLFIKKPVSCELSVAI